MANEYYDPSGYPQSNTKASSANMREELQSVSQGFEKLPTLEGRGTEIVRVNPTGDGLESKPQNEVAPVRKVAGKTGEVSLDKADVGLGNVTDDAQLKAASNLSDLPNKSTARTNLELGSAALSDIGAGASNVPTNAEFNGPTPSQVGRGAIVESGSNANGHYVRWENGEQVCWLRQFIFTIDGARSTTDWTLPANFSDNNYYANINVSGASGHWSGDSNDRRDLGVSGVDVRSTGSVRFRLMFSEDNETNGEINNCSVFAWGFWK